MTETFTLAHLSDVHLGPLHALPARHANVKRTLGFLNWHRGRKHVHTPAVLSRIVADMLEQAPRHIAVTGDLCNIGLPSEYEAAHAWLQTLGPPTAVTLVPGNHDIYTGGTYVGGTWRTGIERWRPYMTGDDGDASFPFLRRVGPLALIGVNSAHPTPPFVAAGRVGEPQLSALARLLDATRAEGLLRVVLIHHPPLPGQAPRLRALVDAPALQAVLDRHGAELVLHGHNHRNALHRRRTATGDMAVLGIASASAAHAHHGEALARYYLIRFARVGADAHIDILARGLAEPSGRVVELERHDLRMTLPHAALT